MLRRRDRPLIAYSLLIGVLVFNLSGTLQAARRNPPGLTTQFDAITWIDHTYDQELIHFLLEQGISSGYSNYWVAYPLAFLSQEELIFLPMLPYHPDFRYTPRDNRYQPYEGVVAESSRVAYITTNHPALDEALEQAFRSHHLAYQDTWIGDYHIFYGLPDHLAPSDLGLIPWEVRR